MVWMNTARLEWISLAHFCLLCDIKLLILLLMELFSIHQYLSAVVVNIIFNKLFGYLIQWMIWFVHLFLYEHIQFENAWFHFIDCLFFFWFKLIVGFNNRAL